MTTHPLDSDLALLAGGECSAWSRFTLNRHVRGCEECQGRVQEFRAIREQLALLPEPELNWGALAGEMRANIFLGLEAGECIRPITPPRRSYVRMAAAFASLVVIIGASFMMQTPHTSIPATQATILESTRAGVEVRSESGSVTLLNHQGEAGVVTINHVYLE